MFTNHSRSCESSGLHKIQPCKDLDCRADVIFVHGLGGNAWSTWHPKELRNDDNFWLKWLGEDLPYICTWTFGYEAEPSSWRGNSMPLFDQATNLLQGLDNMGIGERKIIFITHSLGGLLVKKMLQTAQTYMKDNKSYEQIVKKTRGIVFLATPHTGSHLADLIANIRVLSRATATVDELKAHEPQLRQLNGWYRQQVGSLKIKTKVFYETQKVKGILVVNPDSADPGIQGVLPVAVEENHISIAKPKSKDSSIYIGVKKFIEEVIQNDESDSNNGEYEKDKLRFFRLILGGALMLSAAGLTIFLTVKDGNISFSDVQLIFSMFFFGYILVRFLFFAGWFSSDET
jgi:pimeloyl-ACP methyl ester carboxylesterase